MSILSKFLYKIANELKLAMPKKQIEDISTAEGVSPGPQEALRYIFENESLLQRIVKSKRDLLQSKITKEQYYRSIGLILQKILERYSIKDVQTYLERAENSTLKNLGITHDFLLFFKGE